MKKVYPQDPTAYGGILLRKRKARMKGRPFDTRQSMHLVLRSSQAKGEWSFSKKHHNNKISHIVSKFSEKYSVKVLSMANVGNHLHFHIKFSTVTAYKKFIRSITSAIVMAITKVNKFKKLKKHFWDLRPYTRIVFGQRARLTLQNYIEINQLEGQGWSRAEAIEIIRDWKEKYG